MVGPHFPVQGTLAEKFFLRALSLNHTVIDQYDMVGRRDRRQTVRDNNQGLALNELRNRLLNDCFILGIGVSRCLV